MRIEGTCPCFVTRHPSLFYYSNNLYIVTHKRNVIVFLHASMMQINSWYMLRTPQITNIICWAMVYVQLHTYTHTHTHTNIYLGTHQRSKRLLVTKKQRAAVTRAGATKKEKAIALLFLVFFGGNSHTFQDRSTAACNVVVQEGLYRSPV